MMMGGIRFMRAPSDFLIGSGTGTLSFDVDFERLEDGLIDNGAGLLVQVAFLTFGMILLEPKSIKFKFKSIGEVESKRA